MTTYKLEILVVGRDHASGPLGGIGGALGRMGEIMGGILGARLLERIAEGLVNTATSAIQATGAYQEMSVGLEGLIARELKRGDATLSSNQALSQSIPLAKAMVDEIARIAIASPYQLESVQNTFRQAMAFGFASDQAKAFTRAILNMAAGTGANNERLQRMSYNLAQIRQVGQVTARDIRELAMAGLDLNDVLKYIGQQHGIVIKDFHDFNRAIEEGKISWEDFATDFEKYADENFSGASERMSRTLMGLKSTFADVFMLSMPAILGPTVERVTGLLQDLLDKFLALRESGQLEDWGKKLAENFEQIAGPIDRFLEVWDRLGTGLDDEKGRGPIPFLNRLQGALNAAVGPEQATKIMGFVSALREGLEDNDWDSLAQIVGDGFVGLTQIIKVKFDAIDWGAITQSIADGIDRIDWVSLGEKFSQGLMNIIAAPLPALGESQWFDLLVAPIVAAGEFLAGWFASFWGVQVSSSLQEALNQWGLFFTTLAEKFQENWDLAMEGWKNFFEGLKSTFIAQLQETIAIWASNWEQAKQIVSTVWTIIAALISAKAGEIVSTVMGWVSNVATQLTTAKANWLTIIQDNIKGLLQKMSDAAKEFYTLASNWISQAARAVLATMQELINAVKTVIHEAVQAALSSIVPIVIPITWGSPGSAPSGGGGGGSCFVAGTMVTMANYSRKPIELVEVGEMVLALDVEARKPVAARIVEVFHHGKEDAPVLTLINGILTTPEHLFYTLEQGWITAESVFRGLTLINENGQPVRVTNVTTMAGDVPVYNLHTDHENHNYFADGALVHNSKGYAGGGISTGPRSGYWQWLHGTEAIIPLERGNVPIEFPRASALGSATAGAGGSQNFINLYVTGNDDPERVADEILRRLKAQGVRLN